MVAVGWWKSTGGIDLKQSEHRALNHKKCNFFKKNQKLFSSRNVEIRRFRTGTFLKNFDLVFFAVAWRTR